MKIEMHFLPDVYVTCDVCKGKRYNRETLEVRYKGTSVAEVLDMTVREALEFFDAGAGHQEQAADARRRRASTTSGSGQSATTLSGGEAQRVKLATELSRRATGRTLYILDEPTTGLHFADIQKLLEVLNRLVDQGNTVVIIEHNLDVIKTADWVIDLGPEGGDAGGRVVGHRHARSRGRAGRAILYRPVPPVGAEGRVRRMPDVRSSEMRRTKIVCTIGPASSSAARSRPPGRRGHGRRPPELLPRHARRARRGAAPHPRRARSAGAGRSPSCRICRGRRSGWAPSARAAAAAWISSRDAPSR